MNVKTHKYTHQNRDPLSSPSTFSRSLVFSLSPYSGPPLYKLDPFREIWFAKRIWFPKREEKTFTTQFVKWFVGKASGS